MKTPLQHIENQLCEVNQLSDKENKRWAEGVLQGLCEAYFNMGLINQKEWDEVWKKAEINNRSSISPKPTSIDNDWQLIFG